VAVGPLHAGLSALSPRVQPKKLILGREGSGRVPGEGSTLHGGAHFPKDNVYTWLVVQHVEQLRFLAS
jgi:hypothetical protein